MNSKMKKYILTFGSAAMVAAPLVTVVACGDNGVWRPATNLANPIEAEINNSYTPNVGINRGSGAQPLMLADYSTLTLEQKQAFGIENFELPDQINGEPVPANAKVYVNADGYSATDTATTVSFIIEVNGVKATETPVVFDVQLMDATQYARQLAAEVDAEQTRVNSLTFTAPEKNMAAITNKDFTSLTPDELASLGLEHFADAPEYDASKFTYLVSNDGITVDSSAPGVVSTGETVSIKVVSTNTDASLNVAQYVAATPTPRPLTLTDVPSLDDLQLVVNSFTPGNGYIGNFAALNAVDFTSLTDEQKAAFGLKNFQVPTQPDGVVILVTADAITSSDVVGATKHVTLQVQGATTTATQDTITLVDPLQAAKDGLDAEQARVNALTLSVVESNFSAINNVDLSTLSSSQLASLGLTGFVPVNGLDYSVTADDIVVDTDLNEVQTTVPTVTITVSDSSIPTYSPTPSATPISISLTDEITQAQLNALVIDLGTMSAADVDFDVDSDGSTDSEIDTVSSTLGGKLGLPTLPSGYVYSLSGVSVTKGEPDTADFTVTVTAPNGMTATDDFDDVELTSDNVTPEEREQRRLNQVTAYTAAQWTTTTHGTQAAVAAGSEITLTQELATQLGITGLDSAMLAANKYKITTTGWNLASTTSTIAISVVGAVSDPVDATITFTPKYELYTGSLWEGADDQVFTSQQAALESFSTKYAAGVTYFFMLTMVSTDADGHQHWVFHPGDSGESGGTKSSVAGQWWQDNNGALMIHNGDIIDSPTSVNVGSNMALSGTTVTVTGMDSGQTTRTLFQYDTITGVISNVGPEDYMRGTAGAIMNNWPTGKAIKMVTLDGYNGVPTIDSNGIRTAGTEFIATSQLDFTDLTNQKVLEIMEHITDKDNVYIPVGTDTTITTAIPGLSWAALSTTPPTA